jgi:hypothetical protein
MSRFACACLLLTLALATGCSTTVHFDIAVTNRLNTPVTVWLTKYQAPYEDGWEPPELVALESPQQAEHLGGVVVPPGESRGTSITGQFEQGNFAVLRVYRATQFATILSIDKGSPDRLDFPLPAGKSDLDIITQDGQLALIPHGPPPGAWGN